MAIYSQAHICQCLTRLGTARRDSIVTVYGDRQKTGLQFVEEVTALAHALLHLGIKPGDVVSISALNSDLYLEWMLAITYIGGIAAPLNYRWSLEEAKYAMEVAQPVLLATDSSTGYWHSKFNSDSVPSLRWHVLTDVPVEPKNSGTICVAELLKNHSQIPIKLDYICAPEGVAVICFTSGTTGRPKGAAISHSSMIVQSLAKIAIVCYDEDDVYLHTAPLCHIGGISSAMAMLMAGGCHVILPKFDAKLASEAIKENLVTSIITVPTMMADLISVNRMKNASEHFASIRKVLNGAGGLSVELIKEAIKIFPRATLLSAYGMTEACSSITFMTIYDPTKPHPWIYEQDIKNSDISCQGGVCVGKPAPHIEIRVDREESADTGRILMRGPHAMLHYWGQSPSNNSILGNEGWLDTGDIGRMDCRGNLWLNGRAKDRIKSGGENIYPEEVEGVISQHPGISKIVVVGVPNSRLSEMVIGCIQLKDGWKWTELSLHSPEEKGHSLSSDIIRQFCREQSLTGFKIPKRFILWKKDFPLTTTGKLRRDGVRAEAVSQMEAMHSKL